MIIKRIGFSVKLRATQQHGMHNNILPNPSVSPYSTLLNGIGNMFSNCFLSLCKLAGSPPRSPPSVANA